MNEKNNNTAKSKIIIITVLFMMIIPFLTWSFYATISQTSHAQGQIIATSKTQVIQSAVDGVIEKLYVEEGQNVKKGQKLVLLEQTQAKAAYDTSVGKVAALKAALVRLKAEVYGTELKFSKFLEQYPEFIDNQKQLYLRRKQAINDEVSALQESLRLSNEELKLTRPLLRTGDVGAIEIIRIKRTIAEIKGEISNKKNKYFQDSQTEMTKVEEELSTREQELTDKTINLERTTIVSPIDAIVKDILLTTKGAKVKPGEMIMELVPFGEKLIIEAKLSPSDISFIKLNQKTSIKFDAYDFTIYGIFEGYVSYISPDTIMEKTNKGDEYYFRVQIELEQSQLKSRLGKEIDVKPGMMVQVDIMTGDRTVFDYLAKPVIKTFSESFHER